MQQFFRQTPSCFLVSCNLSQLFGVEFAPRSVDLGICLYLVSIHQRATQLLNSAALLARLLLIYQPRRDGRLSWPSWLTHSGRLKGVSRRGATRPAKPATIELIKRAADLDDQYQLLRRQIVIGWAELPAELPPGIREFTTLADEMVKYDGLVVKGRRDGRDTATYTLIAYRHQRMPTQSKGSSILPRNGCGHQENRKQLRSLLLT